ncbi:restriction system-associated AAA family ATPase [Chitinophaga tropicalis]|uniref:Restriction system-associated AAA family ATPase n=1 Tax=Chitinophaga tropicalis TaxID=2683588 RepID=A0A7K1U575_9BACT|nr:restriction system-associated AAA family ATPase [Chitinophaga tropicalis]MVT09522.1 restriction system-associated AAA family ATPase [Chitinophaga tropicalis]
MKLLSATILGNEDFRSLKVNKQYNFRSDTSDAEDDAGFSEETGITKMIFTGLNGSGKSNFLQFLAEAFAYLDASISLNKYKPDDGNFGFEICYLLFLTKEKAEQVGFSLDEHTQVEIRVKKNFLQEVKFSIPRRRKEVQEYADKKPRKKTLDQNSFEFSIRRSSKDNYTRVDKNFHLLLPSKVVAYSSGHNEMLSNPFYRLKYRHFLEFEANESNGYFQDRLLFLDYNTSHYIVVANLLLAPTQKVEVLEKQVSIRGLKSFRISINFRDYAKKKIRVSAQLIEQIEKLKKCASSWIDRNTSSENILIIDFIVNESTQDAFKFHFKTAYQLFNVFIQLHILNIHAVGKDLRGQIVKSPKWIIFADEIAKHAPYDLPFRLEKIEINKIKSLEPYEIRPKYFRSLSDGEQQFLHLVGTIMLFEEGNVLYLFDEPETHFNPQWKYNYFQILDSVASEIDSDLLLTTHDPVLISGIKKEQLLMFRKSKSGEVSISNPDKDIVGMGADAILTSEIFGLNSTLDHETLNDMIDRRKLLVKQEKEGLTPEEDVTLGELAEKLKDIDFNIPFADPLYKDFVLALQNLDSYKRTNLTHREVEEREALAREVMQKLNEEGF